MAARKLAKAKKAKTAASSRNSRIRRTYNLEPEEYAAILSAQGGVCAICLRRPRSRNLHVDHDHLVAEVDGVRKSIRGLLCGSCNSRLLRAGGHNPAVFRRAAGYLENPPAHVVLGTD